MATLLRYWSAQVIRSCLAAASGDGLHPRAKTAIVAQFRQNSLLRLKPGDDAEWCLTRYLGRCFTANWLVFYCRARRFLSGAGGIAIINGRAGTDGVLGTIELDPNDDIDAYPTASTPRWRFTPTISAMFRDAESAAKNDQLDALSLFGSLGGGGRLWNFAPCKD